MISESLKSIIAALECERQMTIDMVKILEKRIEDLKKDKENLLKEHQNLLTKISSQDEVYTILSNQNLSLTLELETAEIKIKQLQDELNELKSKQVSPTIGRGGGTGNYNEVHHYHHNNPCSSCNGHELYLCTSIGGYICRRTLGACGGGNSGGRG